MPGRFILRKIMMPISGEEIPVIPEIMALIYQRAFYTVTFSKNLPMSQIIYRKWFLLKHRRISEKQPLKLPWG